MKQGSASRDGRYGGKVEPRSKAINPKGVSQIGQNMSNHVTDQRGTVNSVENLYAGRGYTAPMRSQATHKGGSQGKH